MVTATKMADVFPQIAFRGVPWPEQDFGQYQMVFPIVEIGMRT